MRVEGKLHTEVTAFLRSFLLCTVRRAFGYFVNFKRRLLMLCVVL